MHGKTRTSESGKQLEEARLEQTRLHGETTASESGKQLEGG